MSMLQPFVPDPLHDQTEIDEDIIPADYDLPVCLMCEERSK